MKNWQLNLLIAAYVTAYSTRYLAIKLVEEDQDGQFKDLLLISISGIIGEFLVIGVMYVYYCIIDPSKIFSQNVKFTNFLIPAACDFLETAILIFGLSLLLSSIATASKAFVIILTVIISQYVLAAWDQYVSMAIALVGVILVGLVQFQTES